MQCPTLDDEKAVQKSMKTPRKFQRKAINNDKLLKKPHKNYTVYPCILTSFGQRLDFAGFLVAETATGTIGKSKEASNPRD